MERINTCLCNEGETEQSGKLARFCRDKGFGVGAMRFVRSRLSLDQYEMHDVLKLI